MKESSAYRFEDLSAQWIDVLDRSPHDLALRRSLRDLSRRARDSARRSGRPVRHTLLDARARRIAVDALQPQRTLRACELVLREHPDHPVALLKLGEAAQLAGLNDLAVWTYRDLLDLYPEHTEARRRLAALETAPSWAGVCAEPEAAPLHALQIAYVGPTGAGVSANLRALDRLAALQQGDAGSDRVVDLPLGRVRVRRARVEDRADLEAVVAGAHALVFVADSRDFRLEANLAALEALAAALRRTKRAPESLPVVFQWNRRDHSGAMSHEALRDALIGPVGRAFAAVAPRGQGVSETFEYALEQARPHAPAELPSWPRLGRAAEPSTLPERSPSHAQVAVEVGAIVLSVVLFCAWVVYGLFPIH